MSDSEPGRCITLGDTVVPYVIKRSPRARHVRLEISARKGLVVIVPARFSLKGIPTILEGKTDWILKKLLLVEQRQTHRPAPVLADGVPLPYQGEILRLSIRLESCRKATIQAQNGVLLVTISRPSQTAIRRLLEAWYRQEAHRVICDRVTRLAAKLNLNYGRIFIRNQKTRWGSCSTRRNLNFNWRLVTFPPPVMDYVIIHELCHLEEANHSARFWQLVESYCPNYRRHRSWLKEHASALPF